MADPFCNALMSTYYGQGSPLLRLDFKVGNVNGTHANK